MIYSQFKSILFLGAVVLILKSCSDEPKSTESELLVKADSTIEAAVAEDLQETTVDLPSPLQLASIFKKSGLKYVGEIANSPKNVTKYNGNNNVRALNLGVYSTDLAYTLLNRQFDESKGYLKVCQEISTALGLKKAFETNGLAERFVKNMGKEDSLMEIIAEIQMQSDEILEEHNQEHLKAVAFAGAWFESIYIASKVYATDKNKYLCVSLMEQFSIAENIIKALKANQKKEPECELLCDDINSVLSLFKNSTAIKIANPDEDLDFSKITLTDQEFNALEKKINEIRTNIIK